MTADPRLAALETEGRAPALADLDTRPTVEIVRAVVRGHRDVLAAVEAAEPAIARLAGAAAERLDAGGRVVYVGAGSGGHIAWVDAAEWGPTFSEDRVVALLARRADHAIEVPVGPEVIAGSTRLAAGSAQKLVLNAFSTAVMVRRGRTLGDLMTSLRVANVKLRDRAARVCMAAAGCDEAEARVALAAADDDVTLAVVILVCGVDPATARARLVATGGALRPALRGESP